MLEAYLCLSLSVSSCVFIASLLTEANAIESTCTWSRIDHESKINRAINNSTSKSLAREMSSLFYFSYLTNVKFTYFLFFSLCVYCFMLLVSLLLLHCIILLSLCKGEERHECKILMSMIYATI